MAGTADVMTKPSGARGHRHWTWADIIEPQTQLQPPVSPAFPGTFIWSAWLKVTCAVWVSPAGQRSATFILIRRYICGADVISLGEILQLFTHLHSFSAPPTYLVGHLEPLTGSPWDLRRHSKDSWDKQGDACRIIKAASVFHQSAFFSPAPQDFQGIWKVLPS